MRLSRSSDKDEAEPGRSRSPGDDDLGATKVDQAVIRGLNSCILNLDLHLDSDSD